MEGDEIVGLGRLIFRQERLPAANDIDSVNPPRLFFDRICGSKLNRIQFIMPCPVLSSTEIHNAFNI